MSGRLVWRLVRTGHGGHGCRRYERPWGTVVGVVGDLRARRCGPGRTARSTARWTASLVGVSTDPFAAVARLEGVGVGAAHARDAIDAVLRQPVMRRGAGRVAAEAAVRGARASVRMDEAEWDGWPSGEDGQGEPDELGDPALQGALRAIRELPVLAPTWESSPRRALARLHVLAARNLVDDDALGRPRPGVDEARLDQLLRLTTTPTVAPGVVMAALAHAELREIAPFGSADGVVARAVERLILVLRGVDTKAVTVPEAGHLELRIDDAPALRGYRSGTSAGVGVWVRHCCDAYARGAEEGLRVARQIDGSNAEGVNEEPR